MVEPVFGQIKQARGFRGIDKVKAEWALVCTAHNLGKLDSETQAALAELIGLSRSLAEIEKRTGRTAPTVIT